MWRLGVMISLLVLAVAQAPAQTAQTHDTWRQGWFEYEQALQGWCTQHFPARREACIKEQMAKHGVSPTFFTNLRSNPNSPASNIPPPKVGPASPARECCRHCSKGKPCGNSCIAVNRTCHQPQGCAC